MAEIVTTILCVKTDKGCFISKDTNKTRGYNYTNLTDLYFDGKKPTDTYSPGWYYIEKYPTLIQREYMGDRINIRYELIDETLESEKFPKVISRDEADNYSSGVLDSLYEYKYDVAPNYFTDVLCDIQVVCEIENYNFPPKIEYNAIHRVSYSDCQYTVTNANVQHQELDKIIFPAVLLHDRPCKFTSLQMYNITRQYILEHIDNSVANVTSNYDFCFTVKKLIPLIEPETITYQNILARTKKERNKIHTTVKKFNEKEIFEMTHDQSRYQNYTVIPEMCANNETELKEKVDTWLEGLMEVINEPLCTCPNCKGTGYVGEIKKEEFSYDKK